MSYNPAIAAADLIAEFPNQRAENSQGVTRLPSEDVELARKGARLLTETERCINLLELSGDDVSYMGGPMEVLWSSVSFRRKISGTNEAVATLRAMGTAIRRAGIVAQISDAGVATIRESLEELDKLIRADKALPEDVREHLLLLIANAAKACDDVDLLGVVHLQQAVNEAVVGVFRAADSFSADVKERVKNATRALIVTIAGDARAGVVGAAIGAGVTQMLGS